MNEEKKAARLLLEEGTYFMIGKRKWVITEPPLGVLDLITEVFLEMKIDTKALAEDPMSESKKIIHDNARLVPQVIAILVLSKRWKIRLFKRMLTRHFLWRLKPSQLTKLSVIVLKLMNTTDFISSIRLLSAVRTTVPANLVEQKG